MKKRDFCKRGQLDRPFIFIFITIVSAFVFIFGFYLINNLIKQSNCAQAGIFVNDLRNQVNRYYNFDAGSSTEINLNLPTNIKYVCFKNFDEELDKFKLDQIENGLYDVMKDSDYNIFLIPLNYCSKSFFKIDKIAVDENPLCVINNGNIKLNLENKGSYVELSKS